MSTKPKEICRRAQDRVKKAANWSDRPEEELTIAEAAVRAARDSKHRHKRKANHKARGV